MLQKVETKVHSFHVFRFFSIEFIYKNLIQFTFIVNCFTEALLMAKQLEQISNNDALRNFNSETSDDLLRSLETLLKSVKNIVLKENL